MASQAMAGPSRPRESAANPVARRPAALPVSPASAGRRPARPRADVGNSSGPYTPRAGTAAAPMTDPTTAQAHSPTPDDRNTMAAHTVPTASATAPTGRRPRVSARRPPMTTPSTPGVPVPRVNAVIATAENPCSVSRYRLAKNEAGVANSATSTAEAASSQNLEP